VGSSFTQPALYHRGAEYFKQTRKPREDWKKLDDLLPQLAEIDLRCAGGEYDTAAEVLLEIDFNYLLLWGHYRLMIELHERLQEKINDVDIRQICLNNIGAAFYLIGQAQKAVVYWDKGLVKARERPNRSYEGMFLNNLGNAYADLGQPFSAIKYYEQALTIDREINNRKGKGISLCCLGNRYAELGQTVRAMEHYEEALSVTREIGDRYTEAFVLENMGFVLADQNEFDRAIQLCNQAIQVADEIELLRNKDVIVHVCSPERFFEI
jgi:tetratricopeptide (TPR) repeat protein